MNQLVLIHQIEALKQEHNAIIFAHHYQLPDVQKIADVVGDSLMLSQEAAQTTADVIVYCGVQFMAEKAKEIAPQKTVLLPVIESGCPLADVITAASLKAFKATYSGVPIVCYSSASAAVKAECDITCTSLNAVDVIASLGASRVLFAQGEHLAEIVNAQLPQVEIISYRGYCPAHEQVESAEIVRLKSQQPNALVLVHPECNPNVLAHADFIGTRAQIVAYVSQSTNTAFIIGAELGMINSLQMDNPTKAFYPIASDFACADMKQISLQDIYDALKYQRYAITLSGKTARCYKRYNINSIGR